MKTVLALPLLALLTVSVQSFNPVVAGQQVAELAPDHQRRCIPGPHDPNRIRKMPGAAVHSSRSGHFSHAVDIYPHCRFDTREEAEADAARGAG